MPLHQISDYKNHLKRQGKEINQLVYRLYGLMKEDIKIMEEVN